MSKPSAEPLPPPGRSILRVAYSLQNRKPMGHVRARRSVEVLTRVYARCIVGLEGVWTGRMDQALHLGEDR